MIPITKEEIETALKIYLEHHSEEELIKDLSETGIVVKEIQKGYTMHGKVIRPAKVVVLKGNFEII